MTPTLVLTRPEAQSRAFLVALEAADPGAVGQIILSPVIEIACAGDPPDLTPFQGIILTSANAVRCAPGLAGWHVHCVGARTAQAARDAGAVVELVAPDADALVAKMTEHGGASGPLLHLRGEHARGGVAGRLTAAGIRTEEAVVYTQAALPLTPAARAAIEGDTPAILPLFSPRSARLIGDSVRPGAALQAIALSGAVAQAWLATTGAKAETCDLPTREAMLERIVAALRRKLP